LRPLRTDVRYHLPNAHPDQEIRVDQAGQQEHLRLQGFHHFGLAHRAVDETPAHGAYAQAGTDRPEADDQAARDRNQAGVAHENLHVISAAVLDGHDEIANSWRQLPAR
jgi:hypothetical protein